MYGQSVPYTQMLADIYVTLRLVGHVAHSFGRY